MTDKLGGTMRQQEFTIAEAPQNTDARHATSYCCRDVNIAVTYINCLLTRDT